jgi:hypothetical protein
MITYWHSTLSKVDKQHSKLRTLIQYWQCWQLVDAKIKELDDKC